MAYNILNRGIVFLAYCLFPIIGFSLVDARPAGASCPIQADTNIVFYGQTGRGGVGSLSRSWIEHFLEWWQEQDPSISYVALESSDIQDGCELTSFPNLKLYIQPGGNAYDQQRTLNSDGRDRILAFLDNGAAYLGICAGFYYAAGDYYWQADYYDWPNLLGRFPTVEGSITEIADYDENPGYALTQLSNGLTMVYYGGPTVGWRNTPAGHPGSTLLEYAEIPGEVPAAIAYGKMLLMSVHAEAYENDGIEGLTTDQRIENYEWLANAINNVAGTDFYVPPYAAPFACSDDVDNDQDGLIDYPEDPGCISADDNDEADPVLAQCEDGLDNDGDGFIDYPDDPGCTSLQGLDETDSGEGGVLVFDDFESGGLLAWTLYGTGTPWAASNETSYEGNWAAAAIQTGAGDDSYMEIPIEEGDYVSITLEYYRRLRGLDAADDFEVSYFSEEGLWTSLEHLGTGSANDDTFVAKVFDLPVTATKVRFKCECGAVTEGCYVDNVAVEASSLEEGPLLVPAVGPWGLGGGIFFLAALGMAILIKKPIPRKKPNSRLFSSTGPAPPFAAVRKGSSGWTVGDPQESNEHFIFR